MARVAAAGAAQEISILLAKNHALATTAQLSAVTTSLPYFEVKLRKKLPSVTLR